ncbi:MAG: hypothetical protein ACRDJU_09505 [Actinomycetota bacterium]
MLPEGFAVVLVAATVGLAGILVAGTAYALVGVRRSGAAAGAGAGAAGAAAAVFLAWAGLSLLLAGRGAFVSQATTQLPWIGVAVALPVVAGLIVLGVSAPIRRLVDALPAPGMIGVQF